MAWNNRRRDRGAELYDLYMAHRFERDPAKARGVFQAINRLASDFRREDRERRAGRRSWRRMDVVLEERPHLKAARYMTGKGQ
ncbi:transcriptional regulator [Aureimonas sp. SK2]|uniref:transcriptional regulator n=1 Tax=Aureimonas sp. SK2 TaxID=3015992 RepID=UPI0024445BF4|nr:transcriptional regulator [Aureimonas sp. SK2]